jgi:hypothetical protein
MRLAIALTVGVALAPLAGCSGAFKGRQIRVVTVPQAGVAAPQAYVSAAPQGYVVAVPQDRVARRASATLFDALPGHYDPQAFAYRSDWPSTPSFYSPGQIVFYNELLIDYQGSNWGGPLGLGTYRQATSFTAGVGYRR